MAALRPIARISGSDSFTGAGLEIVGLHAHDEFIGKKTQRFGNLADGHLIYSYDGHPKE